MYPIPRKGTLASRSKGPNSPAMPRCDRQAERFRLYARRGTLPAVLSRIGTGRDGRCGRWRLGSASASVSYQEIPHQRCGDDVRGPGCARASRAGIVR